MPLALVLSSSSRYFHELPTLDALTCLRSSAWCAARRMLCSIAARSIAARSISSHHCLLSLVYWCSLHHLSLAPSLLHRLVAMTALAMPPRARLPQALPPRALSRSLIYCCSSTVARYILTPSSVALSIAMLPRDASLNAARRGRTLPSLALVCDLVCAAAVLSHSY